MNKQTVILLLCFLLFLIPTGIAVQAFTLDKYERMTREGGIACVVASLEVIKTSQNSVKPVPSPETIKPSTCSKCRGTKRVKSGDGILEIPCECGDKCKCQPTKNVAPKSVRTVLVFGAKWCGPCVLWHEKDEVNLKKNGWTFGEGKNIQVIDFDENPALVQKYNITSVPAYITLENGKEVYRVTGYVNGVGMGKVYDGKPLSATDRQ